MSVNVQKILIIKTGHAEVFNEQKANSIVSLGDVLRCTFILNYYKGDEVDWLCSNEGRRFVEKTGVKNIFTDFNQIELTKYDKIINLEKQHLNTEGLEKNIVGFVFKKNILQVRCEDGNRYNFNEYLKRVNHKQMSFQHKLAFMLGKSWTGEKYIFPYQKKKQIYDVGFNWKVGKKWPSKALGTKFWKELEIILSPKLRISWQEGFDDLSEYINWVAKCRSLVTLDSLGLHLSLALDKEVIALFGPTNVNHVEMYGKGKAIVLEEKTEADVINEIYNYLVGNNICEMKAIELNYN